MSREDREDRIRSEFLSGNVPPFLRTMQKVTYSAPAGGMTHTVSFWVTPEYAALGPDSDYVLMPMTPILGQRIANEVGCLLPTRFMVDRIYQASGLKLRPQPIPPSAEMITIPVFYQHKDSVDKQRRPLLPAYPLGTLVGGHKKDVIVSTYIYENLKSTTPHPVVIYGWHQLNGVPIQPRYNGHVDWYADYSHGIRLVLRKVLVDGDTLDAYDILRDATMHTLLSDEGPISVPYYTVPTSVPPASGSPEGFRLDQNVPNPFNPSTRISFSVPSISSIRLAVYDLLGKEVALLSEGPVSPGEHHIVWDSPCATGLYLFRLDAVSMSNDAQGFHQVRKMLQVR